MHYLLYGMGAILIAWGITDFGLNFSANGVLPLIVTYGGVSNITIGFIMMGLGRCIQLLQKLQGRVASKAANISGQPMTAGLTPTTVPERDATANTEEPTPEPVAATDGAAMPDMGDEDASKISTSEATDQTPLAPELESVPEVEQVAGELEDAAPISLGKIIKEGDIRGYSFRIYESGEIELETKSSWHVFKTIEEVQAHIAAETSA
ncbi:MAG: hypothetical protein JKY32_16705 [Rhizobiales bacterium]|nr:hypothetical protein [Hyphomicrobiales bacterium]